MDTSIHYGCVVAVGVAVVVVVVVVVVAAAGTLDAAGWCGQPVVFCCLRCCGCCTSHSGLQLVTALRPSQTKNTVH